MSTMHCCDCNFWTWREMLGLGTWLTLFLSWWWWRLSPYTLTHFLKCKSHCNINLIGTAIHNSLLCVTNRPFYWQYCEDLTVHLGHFESPSICWVFQLRSLLNLKVAGGFTCCIPVFILFVPAVQLQSAVEYLGSFLLHHTMFPMDSQIKSCRTVASLVIWGQRTKCKDSA